jgi:hypothetical protein
MQPYPSYVPAPPPSKNGGLYTGPEPPKSAPWAAIPVTPDADYMIHENLKSANPPAGALFQYPGNIRPGNNFQAFPGLTPFLGNKSFGPFNFMCAPCTSAPATYDKNMWCISENSIDHCQAKTFIEID